MVAASGAVGLSEAGATPPAKREGQVMDMQDMEREIERQIGAEDNQPRSNGGRVVQQDMPLDRLEKEINDVLGLRAQLKDRCRNAAALLIEIERAL